MLVKNECQANNKKASWSTEKEKTNKRKGWKGTTERERERERGSIWFIENELHKLSSMYTAIYTCTELNKTI